MAKTTQKTAKRGTRPTTAVLGLARGRATAEGATSKKITEARKTFQQDGHWIIKPRKTPINICICGTRYLKTRPGQRMCVRCLFTPAL